MTIPIHHNKKITGRRGALRLGFVPLVDCAPIIVAQELEFFLKYNVEVALHRELGWASIRDKIIFGELEAAHAIAAMPLAATLGLGSIPCDCLTGIVLNLHGNAITLSNRLWALGVRDGHSLKEYTARTRTKKIVTLGVVYPFSSHRHLLRQWLAANKIDADRDVQLVVVPPPQMVSNIKSGNLDGFCVGEPWNSVAVQSNLGWCAATSAELSPGHPEKVLMVKRDFAEQRPDEHLGMIAALIDASEFCAAPYNNEKLIELLARPEYVGISPDILRRSICGPFNFGHGTSRPVTDFCVFHPEQAAEPSSNKAAWTLEVVRASGFCKEPSRVNAALSARVFCLDIYKKAQVLRSNLRTSTYTRNEKHLIFT